MNSFLWPHGHMGWPLLGILVYSVLWLVGTDVAWRLVRISSPKLLGLAAVVWLVPVIIVALFVFT